MMVIVFIGGILSPAEGIGLENRQGLNGPRGSNPSSSAIIIKIKTNQYKEDKHSVTY